jgi:polysaccharide biosynthesis/export protein
MLDLVTTRVSAALGRTGWVGVAAALFLVAAEGALAATGSTQTPSATQSAQLEIFRNLPPDQQQAILKEMGKGARKVQPDRKLQFPPTTEPKPPEGAGEAAFEKAREPQIKGNDTIVLDVAVRAVDEDVFPPEVPEKTKEEREQQAAERAQAKETGLPQLSRDRKSREERKKRKVTRSEERDLELEQFRQRLLDANPYKLDKEGMLHLPGVAGITLIGLTAEQATKRLLADPALRDLRVKLTLLPVERQGVDALKPFGYDMFSALPTTFAQASDMPVPPEYAVGPGDTLQVQVVGNSPGEYALVVGRDGKIMFPDLGPIAVGGLKFEQARKAIEERVSKQMIGNHVVVSMGELRSITVFITGEAEQPGAYTVGGLSTVTNALFATGGVKEIGSLRGIQVRRGGAIAATLDLYELLLKGDARDDMRLVSGDVIFIPPVGPTVGVTGAIRRPAIYELKGDTTAGEFLALAGGLTPEADPRLATIERINERHEREMVDVDLTSPTGRAAKLRSGDLLRLRPVPAAIANSVTLAGHVQTSGAVAWRTGLRLTDVLPGIDHVKPNADLHYVLVRRESPDRKVSAVSADLMQAWREPASDANVPLAPRDQVFVFNLEGGRELVLKPILDDMHRQAALGEPTQIVTVGGRVKAPGQYPYEVGMKVLDLVRAGGGLGEAAYRTSAELTRSEIVAGEYRQLGTVEVDLERVLAGDASANLAIRPFDYLVIKELPQWSEQEVVTLSGEFRFPGKYPIRRGETLSSLLKRAGGLTPLAFSEGSVFTRESLKEREAKQLQTLADRLQGDLAALALQATQNPSSSGPQSAAQAVAVGQSLLDSLRELEPVGRLVIDLDKVIASQPGSHDDIVLKGGDRLIVPGKMQEVTVIGEVQSDTSHLWDPALRRDDYIRMSGGPTQKADKKRIYVVRANGSVVSESGGGWFHRGAHGTDIRPGDTVVVPLDAERVRPLPLWTAVTTIIYNLAVALSAIRHL